MQTEIPEDVMKAAREAVAQDDWSIDGDSAYCDPGNSVIAVIDILPIARAIMAERERNQWQPIETAPKDGTPIFAWCDHEANPYYDEEANRLTDYGCWAEALSRVQDGLSVVQWGGEDSDYDEWSGKTLQWPNWWFRVDSDFQEVANPTHWMPIQAPPKQEA